MDPDQTLQLLRDAASNTDDQLESNDIDYVDLRHHAGLMVHLVQALDEWLTRGGFAPQAWSRTEAAEQTPENNTNEGEK